jgi:hypothetical protein
MQLAYIVLMMATGLLVAIRGGQAVLLCGAVVFYNWCFNMAFVLALHDTDAVAVFLAADVVSVALVLRWANCTALRQLAAAYVGQIIMHLTRIVGDGDPYFYWQVLTVLAYAQLGLLAFAALKTRPQGGVACDPC